MLDKSFHDRIDVDFAWDLVERFSNQPREKPADANRGAEIIAERLKSAGIPGARADAVLELARTGQHRGRRQMLQGETVSFLGDRSHWPDRPYGVHGADQA